MLMSSLLAQAQRVHSQEISKQPQAAQPQDHGVCARTIFESSRFAEQHVDGRMQKASHSLRSTDGSTQLGVSGCDRRRRGCAAGADAGMHVDVRLICAEQHTHFYGKSTRIHVKILCTDWRPQGTSPCGRWSCHGTTASLKLTVHHHHHQCRKPSAPRRSPEGASARRSPCNLARQTLGP